MSTDSTTKSALVTRIAITLGCAFIVILLLNMLSGCAPGRPRDTVLMDSRGVMPPPYVEPGDIEVEEEVTEEPRVQPAWRDDEFPEEDWSEEPPLQPMIPDEEPPEAPAPPEEPVPEPEPELEPEPTDTDLLSHSVQKGESLWKISRQYGVTLRDLVAYNDIDPDAVLREGQELSIPPGGTIPDETEERPTPSRPAPPETTVDREADSDKYIVQSGDTLSEIARDFGVSTNDLQAVNDLSGDLIFEGQALIIPETEEARAPTPTEEPEEPAEPEEREEPEEELDEWDLPTPEIDDEPAPPDEPEAEAAMQTMEHIVLQGENSFEDIAELYDVDPDRLRQQNPGISEDDLREGMMVEVPVY